MRVDRGRRAADEDRIGVVSRAADGIGLRARAVVGGEINRVHQHIRRVVDANLAGAEHGRFVKLDSQQRVVTEVHRAVGG